MSRSTRDEGECGGADPLVRGRPPGRPLAYPKTAGRGRPAQTWGSALPNCAMSRFLMAGGGTGGHVIPALAVARELRARGHEPFFVGTERGMEAKLVPAEGFELQRIDIGGLNRVSLQQKVITMAKLPVTTLCCGKFVRDSAAVFSMGG